MSLKQAWVLVCSLLLLSFFIATAVAQTATDPKGARVAAQPSASPAPTASTTIKPATTMERKAGGEAKILDIFDQPADPKASKAGAKADAATPSVSEETKDPAKIKQSVSPADTTKGLNGDGKPADAHKAGGEAKILDIFDKPADPKASKAGAKADAATPSVSEETKDPAKIKQSVSPADATKRLNGDGKPADGKPANVSPSQNPK